MTTKAVLKRAAALRARVGTAFTEAGNIRDEFNRLLDDVPSPALRSLVGGFQAHRNGAREALEACEKLMQQLNAEVSQ